MRIAMVCARYAPFVGGVETHVRMIGERLASRGFEVEVLTTDPTWTLPRVSELNGVTVRRFRAFAPAQSYYFAPGLYERLREDPERYDLVHAHSYHSFPSLFAALAKREAPLVFTPHYHGTGHTLFRELAHVPYRKVGRLAFEKADEIICVSNYELGLVAAAFAGAGRKASVIPNGVASEELEGTERTPSRSGSVVYVGRLERYKRVESIIRAVPRLPDGSSLAIIGDGPDRERLERVVSDLSLGDRVSILGYLPRAQVLDELGHADAAVSLSKHEAYGVAIAEALYIGVPCVVSGDSALTEFANGVNCISVADADDPAEVASAISRASASAEARVALPSWSEVSDRTARVYSDLLEGRPR